jgi:transcriptional regulator with XRE-family HTH domain
MTDVMGVNTATPLRVAVAGEVRVALARKRMSAAALGRALGVSQTYVWRRLEGQTAFDLDDLERVCKVLDIELPALLATALAAIKEPYRSLAVPVTPPRRTGRTRRHAGSSPGSISVQRRRDSTRPVSAIPANRRRPMIVGMGKRPIAGE